MVLNSEYIEVRGLLAELAILGDTMGLKGIGSWDARYERVMLLLGGAEGVDAAILALRKLEERWALIEASSQEQRPCERCADPIDTPHQGPFTQTLCDRCINDLSNPLPEQP